jgi:hypothetical protein
MFYQRVIYWREECLLMVEFMFSVSKNSETPDTEFDVLLLVSLYVLASKHGGFVFEDTVPLLNLSSSGYDRCPEYTAWMVEQGKSEVGCCLQGTCTLPEIRKHTVEKHLANANLFIIFWTIFFSLHFF